MIVELKIRSLLLGVSLLTAAFASAQTTQTSEPVQTTAQTQGTTNPEIEALKLKISSNPDDTQSLVALATAYQNVNDWNSAISTWNKITAILPDWAPAYYSTGYANQSAKNNAGAKDAYEQYIAKVKPEEVDAAKQNLAYAYFFIAFLDKDTNPEKQKSISQNLCSMTAQIKMRLT